jgi:hypothetical protein
MELIQEPLLEMEGSLLGRKDQLWRMLQRRGDQLA